MVRGDQELKFWSLIINFRFNLKIQNFQMSGLNKGKHVVAEIDGVRCTIIETGVVPGRAAFLKHLLEGNKLTVTMMKDNKDGQPESFTLGVTDLNFNPVIAVYERNIRTDDGRIVSPAYWNQDTTIIDQRYWIVKKKK